MALFSFYFQESINKTLIITLSNSTKCIHQTLIITYFNSTKFTIILYNHLQGAELVLEILEYLSVIIHSLLYSCTDE